MDELLGRLDEGASWQVADQNNHNLRDVQNIPTLATYKCREFVRLIGHGHAVWGAVTFGEKVEMIHSMQFRVPPREKRHEVAIKRIDMNVVAPQLRQDGLGENPLREIQLMREIGDDVHVLGLVDWMYEKPRGFLFMISNKMLDLAPCKVQVDTVSRQVWHVQQAPLLTEPQLKVVARQLLEGIAYMHARRICHADISIGNIFINPRRAQVILADLGMAFRFNDNNVSHQQEFGKPEYALPEMFAPGQGYDPRARDLRAWAIVLIILLTGEHPYEIPLQSDVLYEFLIMGRVLSPQPHFPRIDSAARRVLQERERIRLMANRVTEEQEGRLNCIISKMERFKLHRLGMSPELLDLFQRMLCFGPHARLNFNQIKMHPWIAE